MNTLLLERLVRMGLRSARLGDRTVEFFEALHEALGIEVEPPGPEGDGLTVDARRSRKYRAKKLAKQQVGVTPERDDRHGASVTERDDRHGNRHVTSRDDRVDRHGDCHGDDMAVGGVGGDLSTRSISEEISSLNSLNTGGDLNARASVTGAMASVTGAMASVTVDDPPPVTPAGRRITNVFDDGAGGFTVSAWDDGVRAVFGGPPSPVRGHEKNLLVESLTTHHAALPEAARVDIVDWSRARGEAYARYAKASKATVNAFKFRDWLRAGCPSPIVRPGERDPEVEQRAALDRKLRIEREQAELAAEMAWKCSPEGRAESEAWNAKQRAIQESHRRPLPEPKPAEPIAVREEMTDEDRAASRQRQQDAAAKLIQEGW